MIPPLKPLLPLSEKNGSHLRGYRVKHLAMAIAVVLSTHLNSAQAAGPRPFSGDWFAVKGATRAATAEAARSGGLPGMTPPLAQQQQANAQLARSIANLGQTAAAIAAAQAQQAAARQAALNAPGGVPDGLASGGLQVDNNPATQGWLNAAAPTQSSAGGHTTVSINQTKDKAILNWQTFNVGKNTEVDFHQQASWAVLNRVNDPNGRPSEIEGQIKGDGTVLLMNRNGIVFTGSSQVNVRNLAAAAAAMSDDQFTTHGIYSAQANGAYSSAFTDAAGKVLVQSGAQITTATPASATQGGGYILLLGQEVDNRGTLSTPQGQTAMAAGDYFILRPGQGTDSNAYSTTRGNEVVAGYSGDGNGALGTGAGENGAADGGTASGNNAGTAPVSGRVSNHGLIQSLQGDITLTGHAVVQDGVALSSSTVNNRGTVHLLNPASDQTGSVTVTGNGVTAVVLDGSDQTALDSQRASLITQSAVQDLARRGAAQGVFDNLSRQDDREDLSRVEIVSGGGVDFAGGSLTLATGGQIAVSAAGASQVEDGATLDVSGSVGVNVAMASNNVEVNVQGNEQRDSPLNRDTQDLNNSTIWVDRRSLIHVAAGTGGDADDRWYTAGGLLEVGGYLGLSPHGIGEWAAEGGTVSFSGGGVRTDGGSAINLSGGSLNVQSGYLQMSWLRGADGRLYDVSSAPGDIQYASLYKGFEEAHARWGEEAAAYFYNPLIAPRQRYENGYTVGRDAGRLIIATDASALDGNIIADTYQGPQQGQGTDASLDGYLQSQTAVARGGQLILGSYQSAANGDVKNGPVGVFYNLTPVADNIVFGDGVYHGAGASGADAQAGSGDTAGTDADANGTNNDGAKSQTDDSGNAADNTADDSNLHPGEIDLNSDLLNSFGLGSIIAAAKNGVTVDRALTVTAGGKIALYAPDVEVNASLTARGGSIALGNVLASMAGNGVTVDTAITSPAGGVTAVTIANGATLDTRGLWSNLLLDPAANEDLPYVNGGSVSVRSTGGVALAQGAAIDVSSGAALLANGSLNGGKGGDMTLAAGYIVNAAAAPINGILQLDGDIRGFGVSGGGTLTIESGTAIGIGGDLLTNNGTLRAGETATVNLQLAEDYTLAGGDTIPFSFAITTKVLGPGQSISSPATPAISSTAPVTTAASWVVPVGINYVSTSTGSTISQGFTVPAGTVITFIYGALPAGYILPAGVFPNGMPIQPITASYKAGTVLTGNLVIPTGTVIPAGAALNDTVAVKPTLTLDPSRFRQGFSQYAITGVDGVTVADDTELDVRMPVLLPDMNGLAGVTTGEDPTAFMPVWTQPVYQADPLTATLAQRGGAGISLSSGSVFSIGDAPVTIGRNAGITVDPGQSISVHADGQLTIDGRLNAWGGAINLASLPQYEDGMHYNPSRSVWIGDNAVLDVAGRAYGAVDSQGRAYGVAPDGGSITVSQSDAYVIIRPGALLDASGSSLTVDRSAGGAPLAPSQQTELAGDGGSIELHSNNGIYLDGALRAEAGGPGAAGGSLKLVIDGRGYTFDSDPITPDLDVLRDITLVQQHTDSGLSADLMAGAADGNLVFGKTVLGVDQIQAGGFAALTLSSPDVIVFDGNVDLSLGRSLELQKGVIALDGTTPVAQVRLAAPYIRLDGSPTALAGGTNAGFSPGLFSYSAGVTAAPGSLLSLTADLVDIYGPVQVGAYGMQGSGSLNGTSAIPRIYVSAGGFADIDINDSGDVRLAGGLITAGNLNVTAAQLYPMSGSNAYLIAGQTSQVGVIGAVPTRIFDDPASELVIRSSTGAIPDVPYSVFGNLVLFGGTLDQGGVVRAPLGTISLDTTVGSLGTLWQNANSPNITDFQLADPVVILRSGSLTSVSAAGLDMPFGGTTDGVTYNAAAITTGTGYTGDGLAYNLADTFVSRGSNGGTDQKDTYVLAAGVSVRAASFTGESGSVIDLSGGGTLQGEGFVSGRGGSVNILTTPLINANPIYTYSKAGNGVYAILPGYASDYAPVIADKGAGDPAIGQQITLGAGSGLPAGTYTLLPASFALLPGGYRVEIGAPLTGTVPAEATNHGGNWVGSGTLSLAGTGSGEALARQVILTPGSAVRTYSQFNETTYSEFALAQAEQFGSVRYRLPQDGKMLNLSFVAQEDTTPLQFAGTVLFDGTQDDGVTGIDGSMIVTAGSSVIEVLPQGAEATADAVALTDRDLNAFAAPSLMLGGFYQYFNGLSTGGDSARLYFGSNGKPHYGVIIGDNATLKAGQVFLVGDDIQVDEGAAIDTRGFDGQVLDSTYGYVYANGLQASQPAQDPAVLAVGNGRLDFLSSYGTGTIDISDNVSLLTEGSIVFAAPGNLTLGNANMGARYLAVSQDQVNIGDQAALDAAQAAGIVPAGWHLTQQVLDALLKPSTAAGVPALERLDLTAGGAFNFYGSVTLDTGESSAQLVFNTPAFYGWGTDGDVVTLKTNVLVWNGVSTGAGTTASPYKSLEPTPVQAGGPGSGQGQLVFDANTVQFGYDDQSRPQNQTALTRLALGFSSMTINAAADVTANNAGVLTVGGYQGADGRRQSGDLLINTPLLTGAAGSVMSYAAAGQLRIEAPTGGAADTSAVDDLGASVTLSGSSVTLDTAVALPGGVLDISADGDITLGDSADLDLAGRTEAFYDIIQYSWGGDVALQSAHGDISQSGGSRIDVSAMDNNAGTLTVAADDAAHGHVALNGTLSGASTNGYTDGQVGIRAQNVGDFAALNDKLNDAGFFGVRNFDLLSGDLTVGNEVKAHSVAISADGGSLTVNGTIDASGAQVGTIQLGARDNLTLASGAVLDAHGTVLQTDSDGAPIDADNTPRVSLTSSQGWVALADSATIDMRSADAVPRGKLSINAPRLGGAAGSGDGANDIAIDAAHRVNLAGAASIAVNAFRTYQPTDGIINQEYLDAIDEDSTAFINAAWNNGSLQNRLAGLKAYGDAFHLRPGAEIRSDGDLTVSGDIDLSGYRYGPGANPAIRGSGEPGVLTLRAGGNLTVNGSITDGFAPPGATPDDNSWIVMKAGVQTTDTQLSQNAILGVGSTFPAGSVLGYNIPILGSLILAAGTPAPHNFTLTQSVTLPAGWVLTSAIALPTVYQPGTTLTKTMTQLQQDIILQADWYIAPGSPEGIYFDSLGGIDAYDPRGNLIQPYPGSGSTIPKGTRLPANDPYTGLPAGFVIPKNVFPDGIFAGNVSNPAGTKLSAATTLNSGTQIPSGFTLPDTVVTQTGASLKANTSIPQQVTLGSDIVVSTDFTATGVIVTPTRTYHSGDTVAAGTTLPYGTTIDAGNILPFAAPITDTVWSAGEALIFTDSVKINQDIHLSAGDVLPAGTDALGFGGNTNQITRSGKNWVTAPMLAAGSQSWTIALVAGADLDSVDPSRLKNPDQLTGDGNVILNDPHYLAPNLTSPLVSVIRTGTGDLSIYAAGDYQQLSAYGVYTAGSSVAGTGSDSQWNVARARQLDGTMLGEDNNDYEATLNAQRMWFTDNGGDFTLSAQGDIIGFEAANAQNIGSWLWRQGGGELDQPTAWGINFGSYIIDGGGLPSELALGLAAFSGMGALGGGNVAVSAGGDIGADNGANSKNIVVAVAGSGRVTDGQVAQTGGGSLSVTAGGHINGGLYTDLRGDTDIKATSAGVVLPQDYGTSVNGDPRGLDSNTPYSAASRGGLSVAPGDGTVTIETLGDLVLGNVYDPGRVGLRAETSAVDGKLPGNAVTWFTLWRDDTALDLYSAGGNVAPLGSSASGDETAILPPILSVVAASGSIYYAARQNNDYLMPSPDGELDLLAKNMISGASANSISNIGSSFGLLGTSAASMATPLNPAWRMVNVGADSQSTFTASNYWGTVSSYYDAVSFDNIYFNNYDVPSQVYSGGGGTLFMFGPDTMTDDSMAGNGQSSHIYSLDGDLLDINIGQQRRVGSPYDGTLTTYYNGSKPVRLMAAGDIVDSSGFIVQDAPIDVSMIAAGGDIFYANFSVAGPGTLEVSAGGDVYQGKSASLVSLGSLVNGDTRPGADIVVQAGLGAGAPGIGETDVTGFAERYLDPANQADSDTPLADQPGKVAKTYDGELLQWLQSRFGYGGAGGDTALVYFLALPAEQQRIFVRQVYYAELLAGGREYNDPDSQRYQSYLRGRDAIAALFPAVDSQGTGIVRSGDLTMFQSVASNAGIRTIKGGTIQTLTPGGQTIVGIEGVTPDADASAVPAGLITQGAGDIQMYSRDSVLLGLSRIMTTFGGNIQVWSAEGDINAGRGSKTTIVYTPPSVLYDDRGNVTLSPQVPSTGAGIATLAPIPEVPPGDIDLIAPLGTIDAGEAGIRVSGNINVAALRVVNAENIQVQGKSTGIPTIAAVNVDALTSASQAASSAVQAAEQINRQAQRNQPSIITVQVLGFGSEGSPQAQNNSGQGDLMSTVQVIGDGELNNEQKAKLTQTERNNL
jgi:filamentous hemagglutinin family protein